jgi:hypothetical protein
MQPITELRQRCRVPRAHTGSFELGPGGGGRGDGQERQTACRTTRPWPPSATRAQAWPAGCGSRTAFSCLPWRGSRRPTPDRRRTNADSSSILRTHMASKGQTTSSFSRPKSGVVRIARASCSSSSSVNHLSRDVSSPPASDRSKSAAGLRSIQWLRTAILNMRLM